MKTNFKITALLLALLLCLCVALTACKNTEEDTDTDGSEAVTTAADDGGETTEETTTSTPGNGETLGTETEPAQTNPWGDAGEGDDGRYSGWYAPSVS